MGATVRPKMSSKLDLKAKNMKILDNLICVFFFFFYNLPVHFSFSFKCFSSSLHGMITKC
uniref:Uncharacterized protein n=1 Tax=Rhizophora mucronata TaxID=61149 RepID=A0A2P2J3L8_RHIMU